MYFLRMYYECLFGDGHASTDAIYPIQYIQISITMQQIMKADIPNMQTSTLVLKSSFIPKVMEYNAIIISIVGQ